MDELKETPRQYSARQVRLRLIRAEKALQEVLIYLPECRGETANYEQLLRAAEKRILAAIKHASEVERKERAKAIARMSGVPRTWGENMNLVAFTVLDAALDGDAHG